MTLIGFSFGARVIFSCLQEMAKRKSENVTLTLSSTVQNDYQPSVCVCDGCTRLKNKPTVSQMFYVTSVFLIYYLHQGGTVIAGVRLVFVCLFLSFFFSFFLSFFLSFFCVCLSFCLSVGMLFGDQKISHLKIAGSSHDL